MRAHCDRLLSVTVFLCVTISKNETADNLWVFVLIIILFKHFWKSENLILWAGRVHPSLQTVFLVENHVFENYQTTLKILTWDMDQTMCGTHCGDQRWGKVRLGFGMVSGIRTVVGLSTGNQL